MKKEDLFYKLINKGTLLISGLDSNFNSYRIILFNNKKYKLTLEVEE